MYLAMYIHSTIRIFLDKKAETDCLYYIYIHSREKFQVFYLLLLDLCINSFILLVGCFREHTHHIDLLVFHYKIPIFN